MAQLTTKDIYAVYMHRYAYKTNYLRYARITNEDKRFAILLIMYSFEDLINVKILYTVVWM
jgi:hypothetical protein